MHYFGDHMISLASSYNQCSSLLVRDYRILTSKIRLELDLIGFTSSNPARDGFG